jgi:predicted permease
MPGYFQTMHVPLLRGRDIGDVDVLGKPGVVIINQEAARRYFPGKDPVGMRVTFDDPATNPHPEWLTIVGVSANTRQTDWTAPIAPEIFVPYLQNRAYLENPGPQVSYITLVLRADGDAAALTAAVKNTVWSIDRALPISEVVTMDDVISAENARPRFELLLLSLFGGLALTLAAVGIYGVMSYAVSRRTHEIAVRLSLGASRRQILSMMLLQGMILALAGSGFGIAGALLLSKFMTKLLYGVRPTDPLTYLAVSLLLAAIALLATYLPARCATGVDPIVALRSE